MILGRYTILLASLAMVLLCRVGQAQTVQQPRRYCQRVGVDDTLRPIPASLSSAAARLFNLREPDSSVQNSTVFRCASHTVLLCNIGANLPCGKANTDPALPSASEFCRDHPGSAFIPMFVTGHSTIYSWQCSGSNALAGAPVQQVDARGFFASYWKSLP